MKMFPLLLLLFSIPVTTACNSYEEVFPTYDRLVKVQVKDGNGSLLQAIELHYDQMGLLLDLEIHDRNGGVNGTIRFNYSPDEVLPEERYLDASGNLLQRITHHYERNAPDKVDESHLVFRPNNTLKESFNLTVQFQNGSWAPTSGSYVNYDDNIEEEIAFVYDARGNCLSKIHTKPQDKSFTRGYYWNYSTLNEVVEYTSKKLDTIIDHDTYAYDSYGRINRVDHLEGEIVGYETREYSLYNHTTRREYHAKDDALTGYVEYEYAAENVTDESLYLINRLLDV